MIMANKKREKNKVEKVMKEFKNHELHSGSKKGPEVTNKKQAIAIALSESRKLGNKKSKKAEKHHEKEKVHEKKDKHHEKEKVKHKKEIKTHSKKKESKKK